MNYKKKQTKDFKFKKFDIVGGFSGMPVSTDSVLLGAWIDADQGDSILDIGTGTGLLSLMCAQRFSTASICAIEIDYMAYQAAKYNFSQSIWSQRLLLLQQDVLTWRSSCCFDTIICNPPYFQSGELSESTQRAVARHSHTLDHRLLLNKCWSLLSEDGKASFVLPLIEGQAFIQNANSTGWCLSRLCKIKPNENKAENRVLIELSKKNNLCQESELTILNSDRYSDDFVALTKEFYLKM